MKLAAVITSVGLRLNGNAATHLTHVRTSRFALPALGTFGTAGRNILQGPGYANVDMPVFKRFRITESSSAVFGQITSAMDPRIMQVALKFNF